MASPRAALGLLAIAMLLAVVAGAEAQYPEPRAHARPDSLEDAFRLFDAGRWHDALEAFETASRAGEAPLPGEAIRRWGVAASEAGRHLAAYIRLRQYLATGPLPVDRESVAERVERAREALLTEAARFSRLFATAERRPDGDSPGERHIVRIAARDAEVSLEGLSGVRVESPLWRRAEEIPAAAYLGLLRRLLDTPAVIDDAPAQAFDPNEPGPRRAAALRLVIGDEERRLEALRSEPYERLREVVGSVLEFARSAPRVPDLEPGAPAAPAPPRPARRRR